MARVKFLVNGVIKNIISGILTKEGDRAIDQLKVTLPANVSVDINDRVMYLQDMVNLESLSSIYNFQGTVKDESSNDNHGTATSVTYGTDDWSGKAAVFNGTSSKVIVPDDDSLDFSGQFHVLVWAKWTATTSDMYVLQKGTSNKAFQSNVFQSNAFQAGVANPFFVLKVNAATAGDVRLNLGSGTITSSTAGYNDGSYHLIEIKRDSNNLVTLSIDNVSKGTATVTGTLTNAAVLNIGTSGSANYFSGSMSRIRIYKGVNLEDTESTKIFTKRNPRSTIKFGGYITKIDKEMAVKDIIAHSFGKILGETEVRGEAYDNRTPEYIVQDLIEKNTNLSFSAEGFSTGLVLFRYTADGKLVDIIKDLATFTNSMFYTTGLEEFFFVPKSWTETDILLTHGVNANVSSNGFDDTQIVNDLTVLGENKRYSTDEVFSGDGNLTEFILNHGATSTLVEVAGTELEPEEDYQVDSIGRKITFTVAPASATNNIKITYEYESPLFFRGRRQSSIDKYGVHAKRINMNWINNNVDGIRFVQSYLNRYMEITEKVKVELGNQINHIDENDVVHVVNTIKGIDGDYMVKSITWTYPQMHTELQVGEYYFGFFENDKQIVEKLHDIEGALTTVKTLRDFESPEEVLTLTATVSEIISNDFTQTLSITDATSIYDMQTATWSATNYGSRRAGINTGSVYTSG